MDFLLDTLDEIAAEVFARLVDRDLGIVFVHTTSIYRARPWAAIKKMIAIHPAAYGSFGSS